MDLISWILFQDGEGVLASNSVKIPPRIRAPRIEERVIGHYSNILFSAGRVIGVNARNLTYTVDWDSEDLEQVRSNFQYILSSWPK